jgi:DNA polymerase-3 subunit epsilon
MPSRFRVHAKRAFESINNLVMPVNRSQSAVIRNQPSISDPVAQDRLRMSIDVTNEASIRKTAPVPEIEFMQRNTSSSSAGPSFFCKSELPATSLLMIESSNEKLDQTPSVESHVVPIQASGIVDSSPPTTQTTPSDCEGPAERTSNAKDDGLDSGATSASPSEPSIRRRSVVRVAAGRAEMPPNAKRGWNPPNSILKTPMAAPDVSLSTPGPPPPPPSDIPATPLCAPALLQDMIVPPPPPALEVIRRTPPPLRPATNLPPPPIRREVRQVRVTKAPPSPRTRDVSPLGDSAPSEIQFPVINPALTAGRVLAIDVESTGLGKKHKITEIACVEIIDGKITGCQFHTRVNPEREVSDEAHRLTGHSRESLKHCPLFANIAANFVAFVKGATLVFHGADNDITWINESLLQAGIDYDISTHKVIDTYLLMKQLNPNSGNSLDAICKRYRQFGVEERENGRHTALGDALILAQACCAITPANWFALAERASAADSTPTTNPLPPDFKYHRDRTPDTGQEILTILTAFRNLQGLIVGVYAKTVPGGTKKRYFGDIQALADICPGNPSTLILGDISSTLQARDLMWSEHAAAVHKSLKINAGFTIKAYAHPSALAGLKLHSSTTLLIIFDSDPGAVRKYLLGIFENMIRNNANLALRIVPTVSTSTKLLVDRMCGAIQIKCPEDLQRLWPLEKLDTLLEGIQWARDLYASANKEPSDAALRYLKRRGIRQQFPPSFRFTELRHNWSQLILPTVLVPLFKDNRVVGLHRIFFHNDGSSLADQYKRQRKVSVGDAVGIEVNIYQGDTDGEVSDKPPTVVLISEGIENSLVIRDVMVETAKKLPHRARTVYKSLGITGVFAIKSCVGVNGLMGIPFPKETRTVVLVADNDGSNVDVKRTLRETVSHFLNRGLMVRIALPEAEDGGKTDINDIYTKTGTGRNSRKVADVLCAAVQIDDIAQFGEDTEKLDIILASLRENQTRVK